jgi:hypothetical protein
VRAPQSNKPALTAAMKKQLNPTRRKLGTGGA